MPHNKSEACIVGPAKHALEYNICVFKKIILAENTGAAAELWTVPNTVTQVRAGAEVGMVGKLGFCLCLVLYEVEKNCLKWLKSIFLLECACFFVFSLNTRNSRHLYSRLWMHEQDIP